MKDRAQNKSRISLPVWPWVSVRFTPPVLSTPLRQMDFRLLEAHSTDMRGARVEPGTLAAPRPASRLLHRPTARAAVRFPPIQQSQTQALKLTNT